MLQSAVMVDIVSVPSKRVYVAGGSHDLHRAEVAMKQLQWLGHEVTHDWVKCIREVGSANPAAASTKQRAIWATEDLAGVVRAEVLWLLMPLDGGFGAAVELGYAFGRGIRTIISGPHERSVFTSLADACYVTDHGALMTEFAPGVS